MAEETKVAPKVADKPVAKPAEKSVGKKSGDNTNLILCWIFAPITSLIWMNSEDVKLQRVAKMTLYFVGIIFALEFVVIPLLATVLGAVTLGIGTLLGCLSPVLGIVHLVVVIMGAVKAGKGEVYEIPVVKDWVK